MSTRVEHGMAAVYMRASTVEAAHWIALDRSGYISGSESRTAKGALRKGERIRPVSTERWWARKEVAA